MAGERDLTITDRTCRALTNHVTWSWPQKSAVTPNSESNIGNKSMQQELNRLCGDKVDTGSETKRRWNTHIEGVEHTDREWNTQEVERMRSGIYEYNP